MFHHRAIQRVTAIRSGQGSGHHHAAGWYAPVADFAAGAIVDLGRLAKENSHADDTAALDDDALDDFRTRTDEAIVLDDRGRSLQRLQHPAICAQEPTVAQVSTMVPAPT